MIPSLRSRLENDDVEVFLIQGTRTLEDLIYGDEFLALQKSFAHFQYFPCFSREKPATEYTSAYQGRVQAAIAPLSFDSETDCVFLCGNPDMIDQVFELLIEKGLPSSNIKREKYISSN